MKALVLKEFGTLTVDELPDAVAGDGEVLIEIIATGICGSDIHGFTGENGRRVPGQVMGHESAGRVVGLGSLTEGSGIELGALVTFNPVVIPESDVEAYAGREQHSPNKYVIGVRQDLVSSFAQLIAVPARNVVALPEGMPALHGALVEPLAVAVHAVRRAHVEAGQSVLVIGGGPIGQSVVLALLMAGVTRIVVSEMEAGRRELNERLGAATIDPTAAPLPDQVLAAFGTLADITIDAVGITRTINDALLATSLGGTVCLVGMGTPKVELDAFRVSTEERSLVGSFTYSAVDFRDAAAWIASAPEVAGELISREVTLAEAHGAFVGLAAHDGTPGKVLVRLDK
ncbi:MAG: zinc-dependent alcohol dehydrogenase [Rhodoglobus sp.]